MVSGELNSRVSVMLSSGRHFSREKLCVVVWIAVAACGAFDMLDAGVVRSDLSCGGAGNDENLDFLPPPAHGPSEPGRLRLLRCMHQLFEAFLGQLGIFQGTGSQ